MKKTQRKDARRNIRNRIVSYLSICLVIMLGLGGVFITSYMGEGINAEAARYYDDHNFKTFELISSLGVTDADVEQIRAADGVTDAEGVIRTNGSLTKGDLSCNVELISMTERISVPELVEGKLAAAKDECMVGEDFALIKGLKVGDRVKIVMADTGNPGDLVDEEDEEEAEKKGALSGNTFTISGFVKHPDYFRRKSTDVVVLPWAAFNMEYLKDFQFSHVFVKTEDPEGVDIFSNKYFEQTSDTKKTLENLAVTLEADTLARTKKSLNKRIDDAWNEALEKLDEAQRTIDEREATMDSEFAKARKDLEDAQNELDDKVADSNKKIADAEKKIRDGEGAIKNGEKKIKDGEKEVRDGEKAVKNGEEEIKKGEKEVENGEKEIKDNEKKIKEGEEQLEEAKNYLRLADENLPKAKEYVQSLRDKYEGDLTKELEELAGARAMLDKIKALDPGSEEYKAEVKSLAEFVSSHEEMLRKIQNFCMKDEVLDTVIKLRDLTGVDATGILESIKTIDINGLCALAHTINEGDGDINAFIVKTEDSIKATEQQLQKVKDYESYIKAYEEKRGELYSLVEEKEKELEAGKKELAAGKKKLAAGKEELAEGKEKLAKSKEELAAGKRELAAGKKKLAASKEELAAGKKKLAASKEQLKSEKRKYQAQIRDGWNVYYSQKAELEQKLEQAKALFEVNREESEAQIRDAKADVDNLECKWLVLDRRANAGYVDAKSNIGAIKTASTIFGVLFMLISAIVCFSTLSIIIEEQKKMVGTVKAFGFHKGEILGKYMIFGVTAAIIGSLAGMLLGVGLSGAVLKAYYNSGMYQFDPPKSIVTPGVTVAASAIMIAICAAATYVACTDILRSPASILMKGGTAKKNAGYRKTAKSSSRRGGSLYSKLIIRNMLDDKVRVAISIIIIAFSTMLVGTGISMKLAFDGMSQKQVSDIYKYDVRVDLEDDTDPEDIDAIEKIMADAGAHYTPASYTTHVFRLGDRLDMLYVLAGEPENLSEFFAINDIKTGKTLELPKDGVLAQKKMKESYDMGAGSTISIFSDDLNECSADVKGVFNNYVGRLVITSPEGYRKIFGSDAPGNCFFVKLEGADLNKLESDMLEVNDDISFEVASEFVKKFETASLLYNLIVIITTGIAILMSFMILSNLANIFLNRKKTELTVMRINGFSIKQTKGYLTRETVVTTIAGVVLGVLVGAIGTPIIIKTLEQPDLQFIRPFHTLAWVAAVVLEVLFSILINSIVFRKIKDLNFRDVA